MKKLETYFELSKLGSNIKTELLAGLSTFLSLSYIFVVNPSILAEAGMDKNMVLIATIIASAGATIAMGLWARLPFVLAPGLEMNAYVAYVVVGALGYTWQQALGFVFWSGVLFIILNHLKIRQAIIEAIPENMKITLSFSVGIFVLIIGFLIIDVLKFDGKMISITDSLLSHKVYSLWIGLVALVFLFRLKFPGAILVSIIISSIYLNVYGGHVAGEVSGFLEISLDGMAQLDLMSAFGSTSAISAIFLLFVVDFYGSIAKFIGLTVNTPIEIQKRTRKALDVDGYATVCGSVLGTTNVTTFVESAVGIGAGGRTGLTAITCGVLMILSIFILPFLQYIPVAATSPALLYVGYKMFPDKKLRAQYNRIDWLILAISGIIVAVFFSLNLAMLVGFAGYLLIQIHQKYIKKDKKASVNIYLVISTLILLVSLLLS